MTKLVDPCAGCNEWDAEFIIIDFVNIEVKIKGVPFRYCRECIVDKIPNYFVYVKKIG